MSHVVVQRADGTLEIPPFYTKLTTNLTSDNGLPLTYEVSGTAHEGFKRAFDNVVKK